ncbi:rhamnogalacturonan acetylesterase [Cadophora sp. MPI-SDFR-AT-0126]|nr:rhamnogalacturonan acetylesterase [Leotiomycetes sp. MPI-SDFR-AT-0126]
MQLLHPFLLLLTATIAQGSAVLPRAATKVLVCSDSTAAEYDPATTNIQGWAHYLHDYLSIPVSNLALGGRSTRSYINQGHWATLLASTNAGDYVIIEMGHNDDDGSPTTSDRTTLPGIGNNTEVVTNSTGGTETVHSFGWYLRQMIVDIRAKGAHPVISSMVPRNYWSNNLLQSNWPFATYAHEVADQVAALPFVDHNKYAVNRWQPYGQTTMKTFFPNDNTHTNAAGAIVNAQSFITALKCAKSPLVAYLNSMGTGVTGTC